MPTANPTRLPSGEPPPSDPPGGEQPPPTNRDAVDVWLDAVRDLDTAPRWLRLLTPWRRWRREAADCSRLATTFAVMALADEVAHAGREVAQAIDALRRTAEGQAGEDTPGHDYTGVDTR